PLPVPASIQAQFIAPADDATILIVAFSVGDGYVDAHGNMPVFSDVAAINAIAPRVMATADPAGSITYYQTGEAALDATENTVLSASLSLLLPLTFGVLLAITVVYFRAPLAPLVTFGGLGIALVLGLGTIVLIGKLVTHVDVTALELETVFVLGVGTDYSIFLVARYREELYRGMEHRQAVVTSVTWAGQSIATSGATATLATLALAFSGVALLSQWGIVLSASILLTLLIALTLVPAVLTLIGPRIFWPATGERFLRKVDQQHHRVQDERTYFYRTGRRTQRHPVAVTAIVLIASIPLVYVALNVPLAYDFYQQLPHGTSATDGLARLGDHFGPGFAFPMQVLVTFAAPLVVGNSTNASEFTDLATITQGMGALDHAASVASPVGSDEATLSTWLDFVHLPPATQEELRGTLHTFVGNDGRTVLCSVVASASGLSGTAVQLLQEIKSYLSGFAATHPDVTALAYGGGASVTNDLQQQTALATERMVLAVAIGLVVVLFVVLRSWIIPLLAVATIGLSIGWAWGTTGVVLGDLLGAPLFYFAPTILFILILGLGIDYNIFLLTRVREERLKGRSSSEAVVEAVGTTGGIITAAAIILASAFAVLATGSFLLLAVIGFTVATAIILDAMIVRTYLVPSVLQILGDRVWAPLRKRPTAATGPMDATGAPAPEVPTSSSSGTAPEHV
ncbi:MAG: MMPL family transporter, partial [Thermoplasmata archaeon]